MKAFFRKLFCKHRYIVESWHYTHGPNSNDPAYPEGYRVCKLCGKRKYFWCKKGSKMEEWLNLCEKDKKK